MNPRETCHPTFQHPQNDTTGLGDVRQLIPTAKPAFVETGFGSLMEASECPVTPISHAEHPGMGTLATAMEF